MTYQLRHMSSYLQKTHVCQECGIVVTHFFPLILPYFYIFCSCIAKLIAMDDSQDSSSSTYLCGIVKHNISLKLSILHIFYSNYDAEIRKT